MHGSRRWLATAGMWYRLWFVAQIEPGQEFSAQEAAQEGSGGEEEDVVRCGTCECLLGLLEGVGGVSAWVRACSLMLTG
jgi:hypothetical protein